MIDQRHPEPEWHGRHWEDGWDNDPDDERYYEEQENKRDRIAEEAAIDVQEEHYRSNNS